MQSSANICQEYLHHTGENSLQQTFWGKNNLQHTSWGENNRNRHVLGGNYIMQPSANRLAWTMVSLSLVHTSTGWTWAMWLDERRWLVITWVVGKRFFHMQCYGNSMAVLLMLLGVCDGCWPLKVIGWSDFPPILCPVYSLRKIWNGTFGKP